MSKPVSLFFEMNPFILFDRIDETSTCKSTVAKAKCFRDLYNLTSSCIACQLVIKQNDTWYTTDIACKTIIMEESKAIRSIILLINDVFF